MLPQPSPKGPCCVRGLEAERQGGENPEREGRQGGKFTAGVHQQGLSARHLAKISMLAQNLFIF